MHFNTFNFFILIDLFDDSTEPRCVHLLTFVSDICLLSQGVHGQYQIVVVQLRSYFYLPLLLKVSVLHYSLTEFDYSPGQSILKSDT